MHLLTVQHEHAKYFTHLGVSVEHSPHQIGGLESGKTYVFEMQCLKMVFKISTLVIQKDCTEADRIFFLLICFHQRKKEKSRAADRNPLEPEVVQNE